VRIFVALDIPKAVRDALAEVCRRLEPSCRSARWVQFSGAHVTLKFIGEVPQPEVERIRTALENLRARRSPELRPFPLRFSGLGFFPSERRPRVFWAGIEGGPPLAALAAAIETQLEPLGIPREKREFHPHLTLARLESPQGIDPLSSAAAEFAATEFGSTTVTEFYLYQSVLKSSGAEYTRLTTFPFLSEPAR
jgi:2'-5' RNA ligase